MTKDILSGLYAEGHDRRRIAPLHHELPIFSGVSSPNGLGIGAGTDPDLKAANNRSRKFEEVCFGEYPEQGG